jgi:hypothetical protein
VSALRVYDPAECAVDGVPFGWERCPTCEDGFLIGKGTFEGVRGPRCGRCAGRGSLKAAALAALLLHDPDCPATNTGGGVCVCHQTQWAAEDRSNRTVTVEGRCEGCSHPMSDGTYNYTLRYENDVGMTVENALALLDAYHGQAVQYDRRNTDPYIMLAEGKTPDWIGQHWSACDEGCRHQATAVRWRTDHGPLPGDGPSWWPQDGPGDMAIDGREVGEYLSDRPRIAPVEAAWRPVDIRRLGWPHDLRPEKLALLCLRCWAERITT